MTARPLKQTDYKRCEALFEDATINPDNTTSTRLHQKLGFNVKNWKVPSFEA